MTTRSICATSCRSWGTSPRGCTGAWAYHLDSETGPFRREPAPSPGTLLLVALKIGFAELFCSSLHALPQLCPSSPKPSAILTAIKFQPGTWDHSAAMGNVPFPAGAWLLPSFPSKCRVLDITQPLQERSGLDEAAPRIPSQPCGSSSRHEAGCEPSGGMDVTPREDCDPPGRLAGGFARPGGAEHHAWTEEAELLTRSPPPAAPTKTKTKLSASCSS